MSPKQVWFVGFVFILVTCGISWYHIIQYGCNSTDGVLYASFGDYQVSYGPSCVEKHYFLIPLFFSFLAIWFTSVPCVFATATACWPYSNISFYGISTIRICLFMRRFSMEDHFSIEVGVAALLGWVGQFICLYAAAMQYASKFSSNVESDNDSWHQRKFVCIFISACAIIGIVLNLYIDQDFYPGSDLTLSERYTRIYTITIAPGTAEVTLVSVICFLIGCFTECVVLKYAAVFCSVWAIVNLDWLAYASTLQIIGAIFCVEFSLFACMVISLNSKVVQVGGPSTENSVAKYRHVILILGNVMVLIALSIKWSIMVENFCSSLIGACGLRGNFLVISLVLPLFTAIFKSRVSFCIMISVTMFVLAEYSFNSLELSIDSDSLDAKYLSVGFFAWAGHLVSIIGSSLYLTKTSVNRGLNDELLSRKCLNFIGERSLRVILVFAVLFCMTTLGFLLHFKFPLPNSEITLIGSLFAQYTFFSVFCLVCGYLFDNDLLYFGSISFSLWQFTFVQRFGSYIYSVITILTTSPHQTLFLVGVIFAFTSLILLNLIVFVSFKQESSTESSYDGLLVNEIVHY